MITSVRVVLGAIRGEREREKKKTRNEIILCIHRLSLLPLLVVPLNRWPCRRGCSQRDWRYRTALCCQCSCPNFGPDLAVAVPNPEKICVVLEAHCDTLFQRLSKKWRAITWKIVTFHGPVETVHGGEQDMTKLWPFRLSVPRKRYRGHLRAWFQYVFASKWFLVSNNTSQVRKPQS